MMKRKGTAEKNARFVSALPLEECTYRLELLHSDELKLEITRLSSDKVDFVAYLYEENRLRAEGTGTLRRWEGTLTRVDFDVTVHDGVWIWLVAVLLLLTIGMILVPMLLLIAMHVNPLGWLLTGTALVAFVVGGMLIAQRFAPPDDTPRNLHRLLHDALT
jgi:hypothetical protein